MNDKLILMCPCCKKLPIRKGGIYCSRSCYNMNRDGVVLVERVMQKCELCGKEELKRPGDVRKYCNVICYAKNRLGVPRCKYEERICKTCGNKWMLPPGDKRDYCSHRCYSIDRKGRTIGEKIEKTCNACGIEFKVGVGGRQRKYCSRSCSEASKKGKIITERFEVKCEACDNTFTFNPSKSCKKYCSHACYITNRIGYVHTNETKAKMSKSSKEKGVLKRLHKDPSFQKKRIKGLHARPNKPENVIESLLNELYPDEYKYTGNGEFIIDGLNPDFISTNGQNKLIEVFGETFHDPKHSIKELPIRATEKGRREAFAKFGYKMLVIWSKEIYKGGEAGRMRLKNKIKEFHEDCSY